MQFSNIFKFCCFLGPTVLPDNPTPTVLPDGDRPSVVPQKECDGQIHLPNHLSHRHACVVVLRTAVCDSKVGGMCL